jgi:hypothetical protein
MLAWVLLFLAVPSGYQASPARGETTDVFAIYLVADRVDPRIPGYGEGDWSRLRLSATPLFAGDDLISYDLSTHTVRLRREALARIPKPPVDGTPFVVIANGQRIYLGVFITVSSSHSFAVPAIDANPQIMNPTQPADTLVIDRAYPLASFGRGTDPRGDDRIKAALTSLGKVKR